MAGLNAVLKLCAWEILNPFLLKQKRKKVYSFNDKYAGINLGCGLDNPDNWIGIDGGVTHYMMHKYHRILGKRIYRGFNMQKNYSYQDYVSKIKRQTLIHHELRYGIPFADDCVPNIYTSHFFEHLLLKDARSLFKESYRVLVRGGCIRICVPSLSELVRDMKNAVDEYYNGDRTRVLAYAASDIVGYLGPYSTHRYMYDYDALQQELAFVGFSEINERSFRVGEIPDVQKLDSREGLFVEARK